ncbi:MAG: NAD-dependent epimerase/dehydratase family protein, partial [Nitrospira sp.]|nr:NAD-dependent epimerase/dehydratase family protein [Nitrospira sp.]
MLGTPLSKNSFRLLLLGSGELGKEVAIEAQRLGVEVIAVDRYPDAPAMQVAHRSYVIDMLDPQRLDQVIHRERPDLIVPELEAIATDYLLQVEKEFTVIPTARAVRLTMNREGIRRLATDELKLPTSRFQFIEKPEELKP